jgi:hypothetical protein
MRNEVYETSEMGVMGEFCYGMSWGEKIGLENLNLAGSG